MLLRFVMINSGYLLCRTFSVILPTVIPKEDADLTLKMIMGRSGSGM
jgi:hypothetical protein